MTRLDRLRARMVETGTDLIALEPGAHMRWLLGFAPHPDERPCLLLIGQNSAGFVMPILNAADARQHTDLPFWEWKDEDGPYTALTAAVTSFGPITGKLALSETMRADHALLLLSALPGVTQCFADETLGQLRMIKDADELAALAENARIADGAQQALQAAIRDGIPEHALADVAKSAFLNEGAQPSFAIIGTGAHSSFPHHHTGAAAVKDGDVIVVDIGARKNGYCSDITRMACLGTPPDDYAKVHATVDAAVQAALAAIRPGVEARVVDAAARDVIAAAGYGDYFTHRTGHGIGSEGHEAPYITPTSQTILQENMVFTVEPGIYLPGRFGIRLEEVVVVTADGCRILSSLTRDVAHVAAD